MYLFKDQYKTRAHPGGKRRVRDSILSVAFIAGLALASSPSFAFNSGSTGSDGAFNPTATTTVTLPPSGIFNFTTVNIPAGVTVTFIRNAANTPVVILASGNVTIAGNINLDGKISTHSGVAGDGSTADDGLPGQGGPGGYDGGPGGVGLNLHAGSGIGPGGGGGGKSFFIASLGWFISGGGGGGFGAKGGDGAQAGSNSPGFGGAAYGSSALLPLIGGSGGGGGSAGTNFKGSGGGGGAGAILIASSGTFTITGRIDANGGSSGGSAGSGCGATGGGGSGGAIRIVATTVTGEGPLSAAGGSPTFSGCSGGALGAGGRIRIEADFMKRTTENTNPAFTFGVPGTVFVNGLPTLNITSIAGQPVTVGTDVTLPSDTPNPVAVNFATTGVPTGNTITLTVTPAGAPPITATSTALSGTLDSATASASFTLPTGTSVLLAKVGYTVTAAMGQELSRFARGERVERVELSANAKGESFTTLITVSGKRFTLPARLAGLPS